MKQIPRSMQLECPDCDEETLHKTLKGHFRGKKRLELILKCSKCGRVHEEVLETVSQIPVRMIVSRGEVSQRIATEFPADWELAVGDEFMHEEEHLLIKGIESGGRRVERCSVKDIQTLWTINYDVAKVKVSINRAGQTRPLELEVDLEEVFEVDSEIEVDGAQVTIHSIKLKDKRIRRGTAIARNIVRIYCTDKRPSRPKYRRKSR